METVKTALIALDSHDKYIVCAFLVVAILVWIGAMLSVGYHDYKWQRERDAEVAARNNAEQLFWKK